MAKKFDSVEYKELRELEILNKLRKETDSRPPDFNAFTKYVVARYGAKSIEFRVLTKHFSFLLAYMSSSPTEPVMSEEEEYTTAPKELKKQIKEYKDIENTYTINESDNIRR